MATPTAYSHLDNGRAAIHEALAQWDATDLSRVGRSCEMLVSAVSELRQFESAVRDGGVPVTPDVYDSVVALKQDVTRVTRLVDACVAFHRGLAARTGDAPPVYNAEGCITEESAGLESEVHA